MNPDVRSFMINLAATAFGGSSVWLYKRWSDARLRKNRLRELQQTPAGDEIAICLRVGGNSVALPDVKDYLSKHLPQIKLILSYDVGASDLEQNSGLEQSQIAARIVEDVIEGLRAYGQGVLTRVHFFPAGIVAYAPLLFAVMTNWGRVVVYHRTANGYAPLYELNQDTLHRAKRAFRPIKGWHAVRVSEEDVNQANSKD